MNDDQILGFRAARLGLTADLPDLAAAADAQVGGQAQVEGPVCFGLSQRVAGRPDAETVRTALHEGVLVRAWGQRDTVHAYRPEDWPLVVAARPEWGKSARPHDPRALELADDAAALLASKDGAVRREDFLPLVTDTWLSEVRDDYFDTYVKKWRYCTGRLIWVLGNRGLLAHHRKEGSEQTYLPRHVGWPDLDFGAAQMPAPEAAAALARRYLRAYGPASVQDVAHFFGAKVSSARSWPLVDVTRLEVGGQTLLVADEDVDAVASAEARGLRLLPAFDNVLMGHADKARIVPDPGDRKQIWKKAAQVRPIVWHDGRAVATWAHKLLSKKVRLMVTPLSGWTSPDLTAEAEALAAFHGKADVEVRVAG